jgi:hypothetical protein
MNDLGSLNLKGLGSWEFWNKSKFGIRLWKFNYVYESHFRSN